jgi:hypothetical protein
MDGRGSARPRAPPLDVSGIWWRIGTGSETGGVTDAVEESMLGVCCIKAESQMVLGVVKMSKGSNWCITVQEPA